MRYRRADGVLSEVVEGRAMLVTPDGTQLLTLNPTGSAIWDGLAHHDTTEALAEHLRERHMSVDPEQLQRDVASFLAELERAAVVIAV
jgi:hypothetical protein